MAKKRKATGHSVQAPQNPNFDVGESKKRIQDYRDVADSDDEFHDARDRILLDDGPDAKRRRKWEDQEEFLQQSDEEVLAYSEPEDEDEDEDDRPLAAKSTSQNDRIHKLRSSDDEEEEDQDEEDEGTGMGWGTSKADLYGADAIETEEQALEEEAEALRLQKKQLQIMTAADYGFDESDWKANGEAEDVPVEAKDDATVTEVLPQIYISPDMSADDRLKVLKARYPEFEPLSQELIRIQKTHAALSREDLLDKPNAITKARAAYAYLGTLVMYFALLTSPAWNGEKDTVALSANKIREHAVMDSLVQSRMLWQKVAQLPEDQRLLPQEDSDLGSDPEMDGPILDSVPVPRRKPRMSRAQRREAAVRAAAEAKRQERLKRTEADLADLDALIGDAAKDRAVASRPIAGDDDSDMGDEAPLTAREAAEKAGKKKSLRFYTSQIAQKTNKRGTSGRNAGGDEDIPYRERLRDRQARLNAEAAKRGHRDVGDDLGVESDEDDAQQARQIRAEADGDDYYDLVAARTAKKKSDKAALSAAQKKAALQGGRVIEEETIGADGKRKVSYAIEKNKGLTPFRRKDLRNPRVKKRKKYEEKKKKLSSIKAVFKGGEGRGGYGGELTGIKKGLVKSTKL